MSNIIHLAFVFTKNGHAENPCFFVFQKKSKMDASRHAVVCFRRDEDETHKKKECCCATLLLK